jgi:hypothetical protein
MHTASVREENVTDLVYVDAIPTINNILHESLTQDVVGEGILAEQVVAVDPGSVRT